jgi:hypothetical protein
MNVQRSEGLHAEQPVDSGAFLGLVFLATGLL